MITTKHSQSTHGTQVSHSSIIQTTLYNMLFTEITSSARLKGQDALKSNVKIMTSKHSGTTSKTNNEMPLNSYILNLKYLIILFLRVFLFLAIFFPSCLVALFHTELFCAFSPLNSYILNLKYLIILFWVFSSFSGNLFSQLSCATFPHRIILRILRIFASKFIYFELEVFDYTFFGCFPLFLAIFLPS